MASPPEIRVLSVPGVDSTRTLSPSRATTALSWSSFAPVTVPSTVTTTWLVVGSTAQAVPGMLADCCSSPVAAVSWVAEYLTTLATAPAERTCCAAAASVTATTILPLVSTYVPAPLAPSLSERAVAAPAPRRRDAGQAGTSTSPARPPDPPRTAPTRPVAHRDRGRTHHCQHRPVTRRQ